MRTHRKTSGTSVAALGMAVSLLLLATCESPLPEEIREANALATSSEEPVVYSVTFDSQDADVPANPEIIHVRPPATSIDSMPRPPEKTPQFFSGWFLDRDGEGDRFTENTVVDRDLRVFAWWTDERLWPVHFNLNYPGAPNSDPVMVAEGDPVEQPAEDPVREGYVFANWYSDPESQFIWVFTTPITSVTYLYAKWNPGYVVSYNANGATSGSPPTTQTKEEGVALALASNSGNLEKAGYTFVGWSTNAAGTGTDYAEGASYTIDAELALYAKWRDYVVGDTGPAGGIVFYDKGESSAGWRYLEAAPASTEWTNKRWGGYGTEVGSGAQGTAIGTGAANTQAIVAAYGDHEPNAGRDDYAAKLCADLDYGEETDWFLPSKDELNQMYLQRGAIGGFASAGYWSSSEHSASHAWGQYFDNGNQVGNRKYYADRVRAARAF